MGMYEFLLYVARKLTVYVRAAKILNEIRKHLFVSNDFKVLMERENGADILFLSIKKHERIFYVFVDYMNP